MDQLYACRPVAASRQSRRTDPALASDDLPGESGLTAALVSLDGRLVREQYSPDHGPDQMWPSFSIAKSVISTLIGCALADRLVDSLDDHACRYLPQLSGTAFEGVTIRHLLTMSSGIAWNEGSYEASEDAAFFARVWAERLGGELLPFIAAHPRAFLPGEHFQYSSGNTHVLAEILAAVLGRPISEYLSEKVWVPCGMERDARWMLDAPGGIESGSILATARDFLAFGEAMLNAVIGDSRIPLPSGWASLATRPSAPGGAGYGLCWWTAPGGVFEAHGAYGQVIHVDPGRRLAAVFFAVEATGTARPDYAPYLAWP